MVEAINYIKRPRHDTHWTYKKSLEKDTQCASKNASVLFAQVLPKILFLDD